MVRLGNLKQSGTAVHDTCKHPETTNRSAATGEYCLSGYFLNHSAGATQWYHDYDRPWYMRVYPTTLMNEKRADRIGYVFENNCNLTEHDHYRELFSVPYHSWGVSGVGYGPATRHNNLTNANLIYLDGHHDILEDNYYYPTRNDNPFPFVWR
jgi:hypothetical protein